jgi:hypothetical protein
MTAQDKPWDDKILDAMEAGSVTFAWDDSEVRTIPAPDKTLETMQSAWEWIDARLKELEKDRGRPRSVCFRLTNGKFRGLKFPDWNPGPM